MMFLIKRSEYDDDVVADRKVKVLNMLLIERSKCWRCCWSKGQSVEDVADQKGQKMPMLIKEFLSSNIEDEDYMMLKSFQWFIDVLP